MSTNEPTERQHQRHGIMSRALHKLSGFHRTVFQQLGVKRRQRRIGRFCTGGYHRIHRIQQRVPLDSTAAVRSPLSGMNTSTSVSRSEMMLSTRWRSSCSFLLNTARNSMRVIEDVASSCSRLSMSCVASSANSASAMTVARITLLSRKTLIDVRVLHARLRQDRYRCLKPARGVVCRAVWSLHSRSRPPRRGCPVRTVRQFRQHTIPW